MSYLVNVTVQINLVVVVDFHKTFERLHVHGNRIGIQDTVVQRIDTFYRQSKSLGSYEQPTSTLFSYRLYNELSILQNPYCQFPQYSLHYLLQYKVFLTYRFLHMS